MPKRVGKLCVFSVLALPVVLVRSSSPCPYHHRVFCLHHLSSSSSPFSSYCYLFRPFFVFYYHYVHPTCAFRRVLFYFSFSFGFSTPLVFGLSFLAPVSISPLSCRSYYGRCLPFSHTHTFLSSFSWVRYTFSFRLSRSHVRAVVAILAPTVTMFSTYGCLSLSGCYATGTIK